MPAFGDLEAAIMDRVWSAQEPLTVREIVDDINTRNRGRELAYTTVQTVTEILHRKGWLHREKDGRAFRYRATAPREEYAARLMDEALAQTPNRTAALVHFADRLDPAEAAELAEALRRIAQS
jgi:predicted transcriptional regulator